MTATKTNGNRQRDTETGLQGDKQTAHQSLKSPRPAGGNDLTAASPCPRARCPLHPAAVAATAVGLRRVTYLDAIVNSANKCMH